MADNDSDPKGLEALLQTLSPKKREVFLSIIENDPLAALGADLVGKRAFDVKETHNQSYGWTFPSMWGDITFAAEPSGTKLKLEEKVLLKNARESLEGRGVRPKNSRTAAEKLLYKEGILQPFVVYAKDNERQSLFEEMLTLAHELGHVADVWQTEHRADVDAEFSGTAGRPFKSPGDPLFPYMVGADDWMSYGHPDTLSMQQKYKTNPKIKDEPYSRLMDLYNRERLLKRYPNQKNIKTYPSAGDLEKDSYIPDRYADSFDSDTSKQEQKDPFANVWSAIPSDAAAHPAQAGALIELNRRLGRHPLEGMNEWMRKHGRPRAKEEF